MKLNCLKSEKICCAWSKALKDQGMLEESNLWQTISVAFNGDNVVESEEIVVSAIKHAEEKLIVEKKALEVLRSMYGQNSDELKLAMQESSFLIERLKALQSS